MSDPTTARRPLLRPGVRVVRRDDRHLQVGLDEPLVLRETPEVRSLLDDLAAGRPPTAEQRRSPAWRRLCDRELLVDGDRLLADLPADPQRARAVAAAYASPGVDGHQRLARRAARAVTVDAPDDLREVAEAQLRLCGVPRRRPPTPAYAVLLVTDGVADRARVDALVQADLPHLLVQCVESRVQLGPFVVPGVTACLRCADAGLTELDPRRSLVVDQLARVAGVRPDGVPAPLDPPTVLAALAWAVRDVVSYVDDELPTTWSATTVLGPGMTQARTEWRRHPRCGCAWHAATG